MFTVNDPDSPVCSMPYCRILCSRPMPQTAQSAIGRVNAPVCSVFMVNALLGQCHVNAPDSPVCSVFTVNALLGQCHVNAPDSPVCSVFTVNALLGQCRQCPKQLCVHDQCPIGSMPYSVLCPRQPSLFCVHGQCPIGSMPYSVFMVMCSRSMPYWVNAVFCVHGQCPRQPVCSVFTVNALLPYSVFTSDRARPPGLFLGQCRILSILSYSVFTISAQTVWYVEGRLTVPSYFGGGDWRGGSVIDGTPLSRQAHRPRMYHSHSPPREGNEGVLNYIY